MFGNGKWKVVKGNLVVAHGEKRETLYMVEVQPDEADKQSSPCMKMSELKKVKVGSGRVFGQKKVTFADSVVQKEEKVQKGQKSKAQVVVKKIKEQWEHRD